MGNVCSVGMVKHCIYIFGSIECVKSTTAPMQLRQESDSCVHCSALQ